MDTKYSFNQKYNDVIFASMKDINANRKDLIAVCDSIRYKKVPIAINILDSVIEDNKPILYKKYNKYMGARHELGGKKGRTPIKCAKIVKKVLVNAVANAENKSYDPEQMYVVHAAANKTLIAKRGPPKGALFAGGANPRPRSSDIEFTKVEIGLSMLDNKSLNPSTVSKIKFVNKQAEIEEKRRLGMKGVKEIKKKEEKKKKNIIEKVEKAAIEEKKQELPSKESNETSIEKKNEKAEIQEMKGNNNNNKKSNANKNSKNDSNSKQTSTKADAEQKNNSDAPKGDKVNK
ncbi:MAG: 50S ribosomal protein L22 [Candidatus Micrarchaeia archaeon]